MALATPFLSLLGCDGKEAKELVSLGGNTMGTTYSIKLVDVPADIQIEPLANEVDNILTVVDRRMSTYRPESELSRLNGAAVGVWVPVSQDTRSVIDEARRMSQLTGGAFDPTVGPMVDLWGFGPAGGHQDVPSAEEIAELRQSIGFDRLETQTEPSAVSKRDDGVRLDLSGIAKGFGVDKVADHLEARGIKNYLVEVGGELRGSGRGPEDRPWRVGIEKPTAASRDLQRVVELERGALATSGNYRLFFERDGQSYCHIIDPNTGRPVEHDLASTTVVAATTMAADALSTSLLVLGPVAGMEFAVAHDVAALFINGSGDSFTAKGSPAFERYLTA